MVDFEPSIEGRISLQVRRSWSVDIDDAVGSMEFWTTDPSYLRTEHL
jgi:hypothetical protein